MDKMTEIRIPTDQIPQDLLERLQATFPFFACPLSNANDQTKKERIEQRADRNGNKIKYEKRPKNSLENIDNTGSDLTLQELSLPASSFIQASTSNCDIISTPVFLSSSPSAYLSSRQRGNGRQNAQNNIDESMDQFDEVDGAESSIVHALDVNKIEVNPTQNPVDESDIVRVFPIDKKEAEREISTQKTSEIVRIFNENSTLSRKEKLKQKAGNNSVQDKALVKSLQIPMSKSNISSFAANTNINQPKIPQTSTDNQNFKFTQSEPVFLRQSSSLPDKISECIRYFPEEFNSPSKRTSSHGQDIPHTSNAHRLSRSIENVDTFVQNQQSKELYIQEASCFHQQEEFNEQNYQSGHGISTFRADISPSEKAQSFIPVTRTFQTPNSNINQIRSSSIKNHPFSTPQKISQASKSPVSNEYFQGSDNIFINKQYTQNNTALYLNKNISEQKDSPKTQFLVSSEIFSNPQLSSTNTHLQKSPINSVLRQSPYFNPSGEKSPKVTNSFSSGHVRQNAVYMQQKQISSPSSRNSPVSQVPTQRLPSFPVSERRSPFLPTPPVTPDDCEADNVFVYDSTDDVVARCSSFDEIRKTQEQTPRRENHKPTDRSTDLRSFSRHSTSFSPLLALSELNVGDRQHTRKRLSFEEDCLYPSLTTKTSQSPNCKNKHQDSNSFYSQTPPLFLAPPPLNRTSQSEESLSQSNCVQGAVPISFPLTVDSTNHSNQLSLTISQGNIISSRSPTPKTPVTPTTPKSPNLFSTQSNYLSKTFSTPISNQSNIFSSSVGSALISQTSSTYPSQTNSTHSCLISPSHSVSPSPVKEVISSQSEFPTTPTHSGRGRIHSEGDNNWTPEVSNEEKTRWRSQTVSYGKRRRLETEGASETVRNIYGHNLEKSEELLENHENCACSTIEKNILQMAEGAYRRIRRMDGSENDFARFRWELEQTNNILKESMVIMGNIRSMCEHKSDR